MWTSLFLHAAPRDVYKVSGLQCVCEQHAKKPNLGYNISFPCRGMLQLNYNYYVGNMN